MGDESLEYLIKLDADSRGGADLLGVLNRLDKSLAGLDAKLGKVDHATRAAGAGHKKHGDEASGLTGAFDRLIHSGMDPFVHRAKEIAEFEFIRRGVDKLLELPGELVDKVKELGEEMLMTAGKAERFDTSLRLALGKEAGGEVLERIEAIGKHTEFTQEQLKGMNLELAKSGFTGRGLTRANAALLDLAAMSSSPEEGAGAALSALQRIMTTGRAEGRALRPFGINEKTFLSELAAETGLGIDSVKKRLEKGTISVDTTLNSLYTVITKKTGKALGGAGADMEKLFLTRLKNVKEIPDQIFEKLRFSGGFAQISDALGGVFDQLDPNGPRGGQIIASLTSALDDLGHFIKGVDFQRVADGISNAVTATEKLLEVMAKVAALIEGPLALFSEKGRHQIGRGITKVIDDATGITAMNEAARRRAFSNPALVWEHVEPGAAVGKALATGLTFGMGKGANNVLAAGRMLGKTAEGGLRDATQTHSPSRLFADLGRMTAAGYVEGIEDSTDAVEAAMARMTMIPTTAPQASGAGAITVSLGGIHVSVTGGRDDADAIATEARAGVEAGLGRLVSELERLRMETGR